MAKEKDLETEAECLAKMGILARMKIANFGKNKAKDYIYNSIYMINSFVENQAKIKS